MGRSSSEGWGFSTRALHVGQGPDPETGAVVQPIHMATTFAQQGVGKHRGFEYSRTGNPTRNALEECLAALEGARHCLGAMVCVDNTFATPYLQQPLHLGADVVVHSATKYIGGHSDVVAGALMTNDDALEKQLRFHQNALGAVPSPFDCWLLLRGVK